MSETENKIKLAELRGRYVVLSELEDEFPRTLSNKTLAIIRKKMSVTLKEILAITSK